MICDLQEVWGFIFMLFPSRVMKPTYEVLCLVPNLDGDIGSPLVEARVYDNCCIDLLE